MIPVTNQQIFLAETPDTMEQKEIIFTETFLKEKGY